MWFLKTALLRRSLISVISCVYTDRLETRFLDSRIHQPKCMDTKAFHHAERSWYRAARDRHDHMKRFRHQRDEVPKRVVCGGRLRESPVRLDFDGVKSGREI